MKCVHCQGDMERSTSSFHVDRKGYHLLFDAVPAWVCVQCGESYFEVNEVESIQKAIQGLDTHAERLASSA
jgi:YgiT-type zinc finger domain-containing protein